MKYQPISYKHFNHLPLKKPDFFKGPKPRCAGNSAHWTASQAIDEVMGHTVQIEKGIASCYGYIFDKNGRLIDGVTHKHREGQRYPGWLTRGRQIQPHTLFPKLYYYNQNVVVLTASTQKLYFHWLFDVLPRIGMLNGLADEETLIYIEHKHRFQKESLKLLGIRLQRIINTEDVALLSAKKLIVPCHQIMKGREFPAWAIRFLRDAFLPKRSGSAPHSAKRIYISRRSTPTRRPNNEDEIIAKLKTYGIKSIEIEKLHLPEQVRLFSDVQVVVAPHGAGLANLVFSSPGTVVIELFPAANIDLYYRLCTALDCDYYFVKGKTGNPDKLTPANYIVDWQDLKKTIELAGIAPF
ncbi:MAG: glycosyltransferase family 61 protein [Desulfobacterales bacterium]|nr:glycosyltransferase family 61 protein [Desulfobacterales bacterium]